MKKNWKISLTIWVISTFFFVSCGYTLKGLNTLSKNDIVEKASEELKSTSHFQEILRLIAKSLKPSVVNIQVTLKPTPNSTGNVMMDELLKRFFGQDFGAPGPDEGQGGGAAMGSGFIISKDGYIVTNAHVVKGAKTITVTMEDQSNYKAELVGLDVKTDIALLKIKTPNDLIPAPLGDSDSIEAGDFAVAIGNPFGLTGTLTFGVISAKGRNNFIEENAAYKNYIQTDVPINPGNSGGPLINIHGQVIGMNSAIFSTSGGSIGIGFAIPVNIIKNVAQQLVTTGHVTRGKIGVLVGPVSKDVADAYHLQKTQGVLINDVIKGTPSEKAGLQVWDVVTAVNGQPIEGPADFIAKISSITPGTKVTLSIVRDGGKKISAPIVIETSGIDAESKVNSKNKDDSTKEDSKEWEWEGMTLSSMQSAKEEGLTLPPSLSGVVVMAIKEDSKVASAGVLPGDVIVKVNKTSVNSLGSLKKTIQKVNYVQFYSRKLGHNLLVVLP